MSIQLTERFDDEVTRGDQKVIGFEFKEKETLLPISITSFDIKFTMKDPFNLKDTIIQKSRKGGSPSSENLGIYAFGDGKDSDYNLTRDNQIVIILETTDTKLLRVDIYSFDIELSKAPLFVYTPVHGNIILIEDKTRNV